MKDNLPPQTPPPHPSTLSLRPPPGALNLTPGSQWSYAGDNPPATRGGKGDHAEIVRFVWVDVQVGRGSKTVLPLRRPQWGWLGGVQYRKRVELGN